MRDAAAIQTEIDELSTLILDVIRAGPYQTITRGTRGYTIRDLDGLRRTRESLEAELSATDPRSARTFVQFDRPGGIV